MAESRRQTFGRIMYMKRKALGYTQEQLASFVGESPQMISAIEKGEKAPSFDKLFEIADFFKTTVDAMTGGTCNRQVTNYIDADFSASDGSMMLIGTQDIDTIGRYVDLFVRVRHRHAPEPTEPPESIEDT
jgi:transcriptional regulator with XRE-family HTH domain